MKNNNKKTKNKSQFHQKRWFVGASGWGLSLEAGSDNPVTRQQKREIPQSQDAKTFSNGGLVANTNFLHNTIYTANPLYGIAYSNLDNGRVGDFIHIKTMSLKFSLDTAANTATDTPIIVRALLLAATNQDTAQFFTSGLGSSDIFTPYTTSQLIAARIDGKTVKVLCDMLCHVNPISGTSGFEVFHLECPIDAPFEYRTSTNFGTAVNLYWVLIPAISGGITGTTKVANVNFDWATTYTDRP
jgi:hypothetical protein